MYDDLYDERINIMFLGMDIPKEIAEVINEHKASITTGMNDSELKAYQFGVDTAISLLKQLFSNNEEEDFIVHINGLEIPTEIDIVELNSIVEQRLYDDC